MDHCGIQLELTKSEDGSFGYHLALDLGDHHTGIDGADGFLFLEEAVAAAMVVAEEHLPTLCTYDELARKYDL